MKLHIDVETFSEVDIKTSGAYKYIESDTFEILLIAYCYDYNPIKIVDCLKEELPEDLILGLLDSEITKCAHNAKFERLVFKKIGYDIPVEQWECSAIKAAYCGLTLPLAKVSQILNLGDKGKLKTGSQLIRYFCIPRKPTKNNPSTRNYPEDDPEKWIEFQNYCINDVEAEREILRILSKYSLPDFEIDNYRLDQKINDRGVKIDKVFARNAVMFDKRYTEKIRKEITKISGIENPNSAKQLKEWLSIQLGQEIKSIAKEKLEPLLKSVDSGPVLDVLKLRKKSSKTSIKKYSAMLKCMCEDDRIRGLIQFYGANRTGRYAGRLVQVQNLPRNYEKFLDFIRQIVRNGDYDLFTMLYDDVSRFLSQLVRTAFIPEEGKIFAVADFSAIEARVIAWLAQEFWRLKVFETHGKIYEASASKMFGVPIEQITKGSDLRYKGKVAELALGYQGSVGALKNMGGEKMGLSTPEMKSIVDKWRRANPAIVSLWRSVENCAKRAIRTRQLVNSKHRLVYNYNGEVLTIKLPSGRKLYYYKPTFTLNRFGGESIQYYGIVQKTSQWGLIDTYGGKLVENIIQAIARDILAYSMSKIDKAGFEIVMHVHDEVITETNIHNGKISLDNLCEIMGEDIPWAPGLPLEADGYLTEFYKKD